MSESIYSANREALGAVQKLLAVELDKVDIMSQDECAVFDGVDGCKVLKVRKASGDYILYNSFYDPYKEAEEITSHIDYDINRSLIVVVGVGMGYHLKTMLFRLNEKSKILAVEKNPIILKTLLHHIDLSEDIAEGRIVFAVGDIEENEKFVVQLGGWLRAMFYNILYTQPVILPIMDKEYIRYCSSVFKQIANLKTQFFFSLGNDINDTLMGIDNMIKNLPHIIRNPGIRQLREKYGDAYRGKPAIIISSGPSLDKNIHLLKEAKGKALLLACDGSMDSLKKHGIVPDAVSSVERIMLTYTAFYKDKTMPEETVLTAPSVVRPEIFKSFKTKTLSVNKNEALAEMFNSMAMDKGAVWSGASVAHELMGVACVLGCEPIVLIGQDLAYSMDGVSHTSEAAVKEKVDLNKVQLYVKDYDGNDLPTTFVWKQFLEMFEQFITANNINCIDATEGGALIKGTRIMTLREVIDLYCTDEIPSLRTLVDSIDIDGEFRETAYIHAMKSLRRWARKVYLLAMKCRKAREWGIEAKKLLEDGVKTDEELDGIYDAMDYVEHRIVRWIRNDRAMYMLFQYPVMLAISQVNELGSEITFEVLSKNIDIHRELLDTVEHFSKKTLVVMNEGFSSVKKEVENELGSDRIKDILFPQWVL